MTTSRAKALLAGAAAMLTLISVAVAAVVVATTGVPSPIVELKQIAPSSGDFTQGQFDVSTGPDGSYVGQAVSLPDGSVMMGMTGTMRRLQATDGPVLINATSSFTGPAGIQSREAGDFTLATEEPIGCRPFLIPKDGPP